MKAYIVPALRYDLLSVKGLNKSGYHVIHDEDDMESGVYAVINRKIDTAKSFAFMSEHSNPFYLKIEQMNAQQFEKHSGYELWHRRTAHSTNQNICDSISCTTGMESLIGQRYEQHVKCPSCMIGKATLEDFPSLKKESGTTIVSNQHGFIFIIGQICRRISACCCVGRQPDRISMDIWNKDQG